MEQIRRLYNNSEEGGVSTTLPFIPSRDIADCMARGDLATDATSSVVLGLIIVLDELGHAPIARGSQAIWGFNANATILTGRAAPGAAQNRGANQAQGVAADQAPAAVVYHPLTAEGIDGAANLTDDARLFLLNIVADRAKARSWLIKLTAMQQVKPLKAANITSFFAQYGSYGIAGARLEPYLRFAATRLVKILDDAELRADLVTTTFDVYHTTYASSASLGMSMMRALDNVTLHFLSDAEILAITEAYRNPWDKERADAISNRTLAIIRAFHHAAKTLPENWYQGDKAASQLPSPFNKLLEKSFEHIVRMISQVDALVDGPTMEAIIASIPAGARRSAALRFMPALPNAAVTLGPRHQVDNEGGRPNAGQRGGDGRGDLAGNRAAGLVLAQAHGDARHGAGGIEEGPANEDDGVEPGEEQGDGEEHAGDAGGANINWADIDPADDDQDGAPAVVPPRDELRNEPLGMFAPRGRGIGSRPPSPNGQGQ